MTLSELKTNLVDLEVDGVHTEDYPKFTDAFVTNATVLDGGTERECTEQEIQLLQSDYELVNSYAFESLL